MPIVCVLFFARHTAMCLQPRVDVLFTTEYLHEVQRDISELELSHS